MHVQMALALIAILEEQGHTNVNLSLAESTHAITGATINDLALALIHCHDTTLRNHLHTLSKTITVTRFHQTHINNIPVIT